jgi:hypothetical protein
MCEIFISKQGQQVRIFLYQDRGAVSNQGIAQKRLPYFQLLFPFRSTKQVNLEIIAENWHISCLLQRWAALGSCCDGSRCMWWDYTLICWSCSLLSYNGAPSPPPQIADPYAEHQKDIWIRCCLYVKTNDLITVYYIVKQPICKITRPD